MVPLIKSQAASSRDKSLKPLSDALDADSGIGASSEEIFGSSMAAAAAAAAEITANTVQRLRRKMA
jgi:hypothetical protein